MELINEQWDLADKDLTNWLNEDKHESSLPLSDILKSTYLAFRQKQIERFSNFCQKAFVNFKETEKAKAEKALEESQNIPLFRIRDLFKKKEGEDLLLREPTKEYPVEDNRIMFKKTFTPDGYWEELTKKENDSIIKGIITGDQQVFNNLYEYEFPKTVKLVLNNSGNLDAAKDLFQDALITLMEKVYTNKLDLTCSVKTYLYSICRYLWMDQLKQNKREMPLNDSYDYLIADITVIGFEYTPDIYENVNTAIESLGDPCKQLLECYYYKNQSWDEIASSLGYASAASARNQKYKCLERVRKMVSVEVE